MEYSRTFLHMITLKHNLHKVYLVLKNIEKVTQEVLLSKTTESAEIGLMGTKLRS